jgi:hypothetical protein
MVVVEFAVEEVSVADGTEESHLNLYEEAAEGVEDGVVSGTFLFHHLDLFLVAEVEDIFQRQQNFPLHYEILFLDPFSPYLAPHLVSVLDVRVPTDHPGKVASDLLG